MKKKLYFNLEEIIIPKKNRIEITDLGCGYSLYFFNKKIKKDPLEIFLKTTVSCFIFYNLKYEDFISIFDKLEADMDFLHNQYKQFLKIFGGNHFIEYGHDSKKRQYILIHSGSNGIFPYLIKKNKFDLVVDCCYNFSKNNRLGIIEEFCRFLDISFEKCDVIDQQHTFQFESGSVLGYSQSREEGNIFTCGPYKKSFLIKTPSEKYVRHGVDPRNISIRDLFLYKKSDYQKFFESYRKYDFSDIEIKNILYPEIIKRPRNAH